jgi:hypothetical protein
MSTNVSEASFPQGKRPKETVLTMIAVLGFSLGSGAVYGLNRLDRAVENIPPIPPKMESSLITSPSFTLSDYNRIQIGMSLAQVELILRPGIEESRSNSTTIFVWENNDKSYIRLFFENGKLINKKQNGLAHTCLTLLNR